MSRKFRLLTTEAQHFSCAIIVCVAAALVGCGSDPQEANESETGSESSAVPRATTCGWREFVDDTGSRQRWPERYYFDVMNDQLAADLALSKHAGLDQVTSCEDARQFTNAGNAYEAGLDQPEQLPAPAGVPVEELVPKIFNGVASTRSSVVRVLITTDGEGGLSHQQSCTGFIVSTHHVVTAAHCVEPGPQDVVLRGPGGVPAWSGTPHIHVHPNYTGDGDTSDDIAVISLNSSWSHAAVATNRVRMYTGSTQTGAMLAIYGYGATTDTGESERTQYAPPSGARIVVDGHTGSGYFWDNGGPARICSGDSGGPALNLVGSENWIAYGVAASVQGIDETGNNECPGASDDMFWTKVNTKASWVESRIRQNANFGSGFSCTPFTTQGVSYIRCW
jgi:hypothetical protein